jgi:hypothetical protein
MALELILEDEVGDGDGVGSDHGNLCILPQLQEVRFQIVYSCA